MLTQMPQWSAEPNPVLGEVADREIAFEVWPEVVVWGDLRLPRDARGLIVVPNISRLPRRLSYHRAATSAMNRSGLATLLVDCLTPGEKGSLIPSAQAGDLADRLARLTGLLRTFPETAALPVGYLAKAEAAEVALHAAGQLGDTVSAVALLRIPEVAEIIPVRDLAAPVMLIESGTARDLESGARLRGRLEGTLHIEVIPGACTLGSGDPGPHKRAFSHAADWLAFHLQEQQRRHIGDSHVGTGLAPLASAVDAP